MANPQVPMGPVLPAIDTAPMGPPESPDERAAVLAAVTEVQADAAASSHGEVLRKLDATRR